LRECGLNAKELGSPHSYLEPAIIGRVLKQFESQRECINVGNLDIKGDGFDQGEHGLRHRSNPTHPAAPPRLFHGHPGDYFRSVSAEILIPAGLAILMLGVVQGIFGWSAFDRVHPYGASRRAGWFIAVGGAVLASIGAALTR
jgi:hypothetical protein